MNMMDQFKVCYIPGGMSLNHSGWWLCHTFLHSGVYVDVPLKLLSQSTYA
jgi:hypothetical protein